MKKYKFVGGEIGYNFIKKDTTYKEDFHPWQYCPKLTVKDAVELYPRDWESVEENCIKRK